ncbi:hypothetical protein, partial [Paracoccus binzhouensis]|uniref:hypothetical protein n=1 Tax=Paracoccus binzhouensis TaxID=2796149 RepID=UPI001E28ABBD
LAAVNAMIYMRNITITTAKSATYLENVGCSITKPDTKVCLAIRFFFGSIMGRTKAFRGEGL